MKIIPASYEIMDDLDGQAILKKLELCARVCYKSEGKIEDGSAEKFLANIIKRGHEAVLEHYSFTVKFIVDRGVSHEIVRHRLASYCQESTRYCVAGDMILHTTNPHNRPTIRELYQNKKNSKNGSWKRVKIRQYNDNTHLLDYSKIKDIWFLGKKECLKIKTKLGYEIICTPSHEILTKETGEYTKAVDLKIGDKIGVNGTTELYKNYAWLYDQNITQNKTFTQISEEFGFGVSSLKKWAKKLGIPKKGTGYFNIGRTPWNKGIQDSRQVDALRKYHHKNGDKRRILKSDTKLYQKHNCGYCEICGETEGIEVHHIDKDRSNNYKENLISVCESCHLRVHSKNLMTCYMDEIVSISNVGEIDVYDIEMCSKWHNFVANGVVVHNCNYSKDGFGSEITVIEPCFLERNTKAWDAWESSMKCAESSYFDLLEIGCTPQEARSVLPNSLKTELVMTADVREWRHFLKLRTSTAAHPQMREVAVPLLAELKKKVPVLFYDIILE